ncbi:hypothetical protein H4R99_001033 [Coemansia sp. RSA 1722]|nr:hypothetical protein LPJ57_011222 [Coemansia sp. RSA 486]KAJ2234386.1 hypothetical protein IWW45_003451 [Coemansia sp. RSA 485]KAJ2605549.1 hypothetical protein H4R99_001033 [Coemansia sp. RSA 1722]
MPQIEFHTGSVSQVVRDLHMPVKEKVLEGEKDNLINPVFDALVLDMPTPWEELPLVYGFLKTDRAAVCYLPNMSQVMELVAKCRPWPLLVENIVEVNWRQWDIRSTVIRSTEDEAQDQAQAMVCRPAHVQIGHTAFLVQLRKCASDITKAVQE